MNCGPIALDDVDVLIDRVGRAEIPHGLGHALRGRQDVEALVALGPEEVPAALQVADQAVGLVLRRDRDAADAGIERVRQREVDDARLAAEIDGGLGAPVGQLHQAAAAAAGEHIGHRVAGIGRREAELLCGLRLDHHRPPCQCDARRAPRRAENKKQRRERRQGQRRRGGEAVRGPRLRGDAAEIAHVGAAIDGRRRC